MPEINPSHLVIRVRVRVRVRVRGRVRVRVRSTPPTSCWARPR
jgi:hypothetical protein